MYCCAYLYDLVPRFAAGFLAPFTERLYLRQTYFWARMATFFHWLGILMGAVDLDVVTHRVVLVLKNHCPTPPRISNERNGYPYSAGIP